MKTKANSITSVTLVGVLGDKFPLRHGNCFSVKTDDGEKKIVNFFYENLKHLIDNGLTFPINIESISKHHAIIHDDRIPEDFYETRYCEVCCPTHLLPIPQQKARERLISSGKLMVKQCGDYILEKMNVEAKMHPLKVKFTLEQHVPMEVKIVEDLKANPEFTNELLDVLKNDSPNETTLKAIDESRNNTLQQFENEDELYRSLNE
jgi:hypothetical protein